MVSNRGKELKIICSLVILFAVALVFLADMSDSSAWSDELLRTQTAPSVSAEGHHVISDTGVIAITFEAGQYEINQIGKYSVIDMEGFGSITNPGEPMLPSKTFLTGLPPGAEAVSVDIAASDDHEASTDGLISYHFFNIPPNAPSTPSGRDWDGRPGIPYTFSTSATDPDGDQVKYTFVWGDGSTSETGFVDSGTTASASHTWEFTLEALEGKTYYIKAKATDSKGDSSMWSEPKALTIVLLYHLNPDFAAFPRKGEAPLEVRFENWTDGGERPYVKAEWDFNNDGVIDITLMGTDAEVMADVTWTYLLPGVYSVYLTMTDSYPPPFGPYAHTETKLGYITVLFNAWAYDTNGSGVIEKEEAIKAVQDYFAELITKAQVLEVLQLYFS